MKVPIGWIKDYVDINVTPKQFADAMTMSGSKVEGVGLQYGEISNVVTGKIVSLEKHPEADKLRVSKVDIGSEIIQIVTGAPNVNIGDCIPVALVGATLPQDKKIEKGNLRGVDSFGMMCSIQELNLSKEDYPDAPENGVYILPMNTELGKDIKDVLELNESVVEFEITSNRPDCLSVIGLSREAAVTLDTEFKKPVVNVKEAGDSVQNYISVEIKEESLCPRYAARIVKDVTIKSSPRWMRERLKAAGIRPINNIVDITNYVMLEYGQPMHAFDIDYVKGRKIIVRKAFDGEKMLTLDEQERDLDSSMLVIADEVKPIAIAGVMGGLNSGVVETTKTILFECANFNGTSVRLTSKKIGLRSESSGRFEKGLDPQNVLNAINRACELVEQLESGTVCKGVIDCYPGKPIQREIKLRSEKINALLGTNITKEEILKILSTLEFDVDTTQNIVKVPSFRNDVECEADLAEEIARFYGYNNIEATLLSGKASTHGYKTFKQKVEDNIRNTMIGSGLSETFTYSFVSPKVFDKINLPQNDDLRNAVVIKNPIGEDFSIMRTTTIPNMLEVISTNYNRRIEGASFFELSYVYIPDLTKKDTLPEEKMVLTIGMYGNTDFYEVKGVVEEMFDSLGIKGFEFEPVKDNQTFHPGRTANIIISNENAGIIGQIHPAVSEKFECGENTYVCVIFVDKLVNNVSMDVKYKALPKFPAIVRDIAMIVKEDVLVKNIENIIIKNAGDILEEILLFDVYKGKQVPEGMKSIAYSITFRAIDRTLTDNDVNKSMENILVALKTNIGAELR